MPHATKALPFRKSSRHGRAPRVGAQPKRYPEPVPPTSSPLNRLTLREQVLENLRDAIVSGQLRPGSVLTETELAERFAVSRGTVREAMRALQSARLITGDARGTLQVHVPDEQEISEVYRVRAALEGLALREIIASANRGEYAEQLRRALPPDGGGLTFIEALDIDLAFHEQLCRLSGNETLLESWKRLEDRMRVVLLSSGRAEPLDLMGRAHHAPIVDAIDAGDLNEATELIYKHMDVAADQWSSDWRARAS